MKRRRNLVFTFVAILVFLLGGAIAVVVVGPPGPKIVCHKLLNAGLEQWMMDNTNGVKYPNIGGNSRQSLAPVLPIIRGEADMLRDYGYVPGLHDDDPENLILFYLKEPSRRTWHGDGHWFTGTKRWLIVNPQWTVPDYETHRAGGEANEVISLAEFKTRLSATIDYLKTNERPNWRAVEQEHLRFLNSLPAN